MHFGDIDYFYYEWDIDGLPWDAVTPVSVGQEHPEDLDPRLIARISAGPLSGLGEDKKNARAASTAFLYMYMILAKGGERYIHPILLLFERLIIMDGRPSFNFTARSTLPIGAGLGSSASFSVCAATALLILHRRINPPPPPAPTSPTTGHIHLSHQGRRAIPFGVAEEVNRWAFVAEKVLHGNPSGVDNSVAVFGGALAYIKAGFEKKSGMEGIQG